MSEAISGVASSKFPDFAEFIIGRAFARPVGSSGLQGLLTIGLVVVQIVVVWARGVEPRNRGLEEVATATA
jgi:hypothetical protein